MPCRSFPGRAHMVKEPACQCRRHKTPVQTLVGKIPWRRAKYSCLENPHGQRSLEGHSPWDCKESETTEPFSMLCRSRTTTELEGHWTPNPSLPSPLRPAPPWDTCTAWFLTEAGPCAQGHTEDSGLGPQGRHGPPISWKIQLSILPSLQSPVRLTPQGVLLYLCPSPNSCVEIPAPHGDAVGR